MRRRQADTRQQHRKAPGRVTAGGVHGPRATAQQPAHGFQHHLFAGHAQRLQLGARRVQLDEDDGKFAVLARGQIHLAVQLVLEVRAPVQAGSRVAHRLVGDLAAQAVVGTLLLLDLVQRSAQLLFALALGRLVEPDGRQPAAALCIGRAEHTQHGKLMPHAAPFKVVVAEQRRAMRDGGLLRGAQGHGHRGVEEIGITAAQQFVLGLAQKTHHRGADMRVAAGFQVLDGQQATPLVHQRRHGRAQHRREVGSGQDRGVHLVRGDVHAVHAFGRFPGVGGCRRSHHCWFLRPILVGPARHINAAFDSGP